MDFRMLCATACMCGVMLSVAGTRARAQSLDDATILALFDQANGVDIAMGRLGWQQGRADDVKALARQVAADHEGVQQQGRQLAKKLGLVPTLPSADTGLSDQVKTMTRLSALAPESFDRAYLANEIAFHAGVIEAVKTALIPAARSPELKALLEAVLPAFQHHLDATRAVARKLHLE
jgi:putative membrane protein